MTTVRKTFGIHTTGHRSRRNCPYIAKKFIFLVSITIIPCLFSISRQSAHAVDDQLSIGQIQGRGGVSPYLEKIVHFQGIVTGFREDENEQGARFYSVFVQELLAYQDSDPVTSDGIAIFFGPERPAIAIGDYLDVRGRVIEYYSLTEIDFRDLNWQVLGHNQPLPLATPLNPPADNQGSSEYFESLEGMLVSVAEGVVVGPTHKACGFAVVAADAFTGRPFRHHVASASGSIINVLHHSDVNCDNIPQVNFGDKIYQISGPLTFDFGQFKVVNQVPTDLLLRSLSIPVLTQAPSPEEGQISIATFNLDEYFDTKNDTGMNSEPVLDSETFEIKRAKISAVIASVLNCPTLIGVQEVESRKLLDDLADQLEKACNFRYEISHLPAPDSRGSDVALMSNYEQIVVTKLKQLQACSELDTGIIDSSISCNGTMQPLFSRPPLLVELEVNKTPLTVVVNHFKSKRGGEDLTEPRRLAQADYLYSQLPDVASTPTTAGIIVVGDFNDYYHSPLMETLTKDGQLISVLDRLPPRDQYSYIFDGTSQLIDWILVSPNLEELIVETDILHVNADYHYGYSVLVNGENKLIRSSDHDIPIAILQIVIPPESQSTATSLPPTVEEERAVDQNDPSSPVFPGETASAPASPVSRRSEISITQEGQINAPSTQTPSRGGSTQLGSSFLVIVLAIGVGLTAIWLRRRL